MDYFMLEDPINLTLKLVEIDYAHVAFKLATYIIMPMKCLVRWLCRSSFLIRLNCTWFFKKVFQKNQLRFPEIVWVSPKQLHGLRQVENPCLITPLLHGNLT